MPLHIKSVSIRNFRCFKSLDLNIEQFTVLVGENGCGKTSILEAVNLALSRNVTASKINEQDFNADDEGGIEIEVVFDNLFIASLPDGYASQPVPCDRVRLSVKRRERGAPGRALNDGFVISHVVVPDSTVSTTAKGWKVSRKSGRDFEFDQRALNMQSVDASDLPRCFLFDRHRERQSSVGFSSTMSRLVEDLNWRFMNGLDPTGRAAYQKQWEGIYATILTAADSQKFKESVREVQQRLVAMLGDHYDSLELSLVELERPFAKSFFATRDGLNQVAQDGLGSGVSLIISYLLLEAIRKMSKESLVILIDEPELHLHPQLQAQFCSHLRTAGFDVILSTHAAAMINFADWRGVKRINRGGICHPTVATLARELPVEGKPRAVSEHLEDIRAYRQNETVFFREARDLLFARGVVLVEGPVDRYGIEVLADRHGLDLRDLTIICCHGKTKIPHYQILCHAFGVPFITIMDKDLHSKNEGDRKPNDMIFEWAMPGHLFAFENSFENALGVTEKKHKTTEAMNAIDDYDFDALIQEVSDMFLALKAFAVAVRTGTVPMMLDIILPEQPAEATPEAGTEPEQKAGLN